MHLFVATVFTVGKLGMAVLASSTAAMSFMLLRRKSNTLEARAEHAFREQLLRGIAEWCAPKLGCGATVLLSKLEAAFDADWQVLRPLSGIGRIDLRLQKDSTTQVTRTVGVRLSNGDIPVGALSRTYAWDQLPARYRSEFIRRGDSTLCWSLYDANDLANLKPSSHASDPAV